MAGGARLRRRRARLEPQGILLRRDHARAGTSTLALADLRDETLLVHPREANPGHYDAVLALCAQAGFEPRLTMRALSFDLAHTPISGTWRGREAIMGEFLATALRHYEPGSVSLEVTSLLADGDAVAVEWTSRARTASGAPYENHCAAIFRVRDGRIQAVREYMDTLYASRVAFNGAGGDSPT